MDAKMSEPQLGLRDLRELAAEALPEPHITLDLGDMDREGGVMWLHPQQADDLRNSLEGLRIEVARATEADEDVSSATSDMVDALAYSLVNQVAPPRYTWPGRTTGDDRVPSSRRRRNRRSKRSRAK